MINRMGFPKKNYASLFATLTMACLTVACTKAPKSDDSGSGDSSGKYIYVASGTVYAGNGITPSTASKTIAKYDMNGTFLSLVRDYSNSSSDSPAAIIDYDSTRLLVLIENTAGRRVEYVNKDGSGVTTVFSNTTNLNAVVHSFILDYSNQFLIAKNTGIEKMQYSGNQTVGPAGGTYISNPAGACATTNTLVVDVKAAPSPYNFVLYAHAAASPNNKVVAIKATGYGAAGDCLAATPAAPTTGHYPTSLLMHSSGVLFVGYGNNTGLIHQIYAFNPTFTSTTADFGSNASSAAFNDLSVLQGISRMIEMPDGSILVSAAGPTMNTIERFTYNSTTGALTRVGNVPFIGPAIFTRSVSGLLIAN